MLLSQPSSLHTENQELEDMKMGTQGARSPLLVGDAGRTLPAFALLKRSSAKTHFSNESALLPKAEQAHINQLLIEPRSRSSVG